jgi:alanine racemase
MPKNKSSVLGTTVLVDGKECKVIGDFISMKTMLVDTKDGILILNYGNDANTSK